MPETCGTMWARRSLFNTISPGTLICFDLESTMISELYYRVNGGNYTLYSGCFSLPVGVYTICYYGVDEFGFHTSTTCIIIEVVVHAALAPTTTININPGLPDSSNGWYTFTGNSSGNWIINATKAGFITSSPDTTILVGNNSAPVFLSYSIMNISTFDENALTNFTVLLNDSTGVIDTVFLENNFTGNFVNTTMYGSYPNYYYNLTLGAGSYQIRFLANDSFNAWNFTNVVTFTIAEVTSVIDLFLNGTSSNRTYVVNEPINITATLNLNFSFDLYFNDSLLEAGFSPITNITSCGTLGTYNVTAFFAGDQNYTSAIRTWWITIFRSYTKTGETTITWR